MDQTQVVEISSRLRDLKEASRETNRSIADYCDVTERTVAGWLSPSEPKPMTWDHAERAAELFEVDVDWLWRGRTKGSTPDPFANPQLDRIEESLERIEQALAPSRSKEVGERLSREVGDVLPTDAERDRRESRESKRSREAS